MGFAHKYKVGIMSRKDLFTAVEHAMNLKPGQLIVRINDHRGKKYEVRAIRRPHGIQLDWALPGTFHIEKYDNE